ncbi:MAG: GTPase HflX [Verrucomicrobia bacterium]|nr:MAG: GTPase HflX [Verrucomicrobiota bacterium]
MDCADATLVRGAARAALVGIAAGEKSEAEAAGLVDELGELAQNLGIEIARKSVVKLRQIDARHFVGSGKLSLIIREAKEAGADIIIVDDELSPAQQRSWEAAAQMPVVNRQEIILDIFAARANTREARLQVELAKLEYSLPRLRRAWSHLDRQRGGGVTQRGGGESQLELDRRSVREQIAKLKRELAQVRVSREVQRKRRMRAGLPAAAVVGYTNAGKSSLINLLTSSDLLAQDKLFATLDPSTRRMRLPGGKTLLLTDTVGFVRNLPHRFVEAFKATLEEALVSDFLVHVVDSSSPAAEEHMRTTMRVMGELGADGKRVLTVFNKADVPSSSQNFHYLRSLCPAGVWISAKTGENVDALRAALEKMVASGSRFMRLKIPHSESAAIARAHEVGTIAEKKALSDCVEMSVSIPLGAAPYFEKWLV